jgi:hypothetical protein
MKLIKINLKNKDSKEGRMLKVSRMMLKQKSSKFL